MAGYAKATIVGNLGKDPEFHRFQNGNEQCTFSMATSEQWRDKQTGERRERTTWHNIVVRNDNLIKVCKDYVSKGSKIMVVGDIQTREWEKDGIKRYTTEIVLGPFNSTLLLLSGKGEGGDDRGGDRGGSREQTSSKSGGERAGAYAADLDDDIPF